MIIPSHFITAIIAVAIVLGFILSRKIKRRSKDKNSIISWYNHLIDQYLSINQNVADQLNEKIELAEKYNDQDSLKRLQKRFEDTARISNSIEKKLNSLKANIEAKRFNGVSFDALFNDLKVTESYVAELTNIATKNNNSGYGYWSLTSHKEPKNDIPWKSSRFFSSCNTKEMLTKKYRELAKIYHPDNTTTGNTESFKKLKAEYDEYF